MSKIASIMFKKTITPVSEVKAIAGCSGRRLNRPKIPPIKKATTKVIAPYWTPRLR